MTVTVAPTATSVTEQPPAGPPSIAKQSVEISRRWMIQPRPHTHTRARACVRVITWIGPLLLITEGTIHITPVLTCGHVRQPQTPRYR